MIFEGTVTLVSFALCLLPALLLLRTGGLFVPSHLIFTALFVPALHFANLFGDSKWEAVYYLATHLAWVLYSWVIYSAVLVGKKQLLTDRHWLDKAKDISDGWLVMAFVAWIVFKLYLVSVYGVQAFKVWRELSGIETIFSRYEWWEVALERYIILFAVGACMMWVIKAVIIPDYWKRVRVLLPLLIFILPFIVALESPIGSRRFILILVIVGLLAYLKSRKLSVSHWFLRQWPRLILLGFVTVSISVYYQIVRQNYFEPDIAAHLTSNKPIEIIKGVGMTLLPRFDIESDVDRGGAINRDGPFELTYEIISALGNGQAGTRGEITSVSIDTAVPRVFVSGAKLQINADDVIAGRMSITPKSDYINPDMSTSVLAIFIADYGMLGMFLAPVVVVFGFAMLSYIGRSKLTRDAPWVLLWLAMLLHFAGGVENDLVSILTTVRDALFVLPLAVVMSWRKRQYGMLIRSSTLTEKHTLRKSKPRST